ncbi:MAG: hypothetical protein LLG06_04055 [Desulfobacteraceae bacterium]|nr:hypothetical protein [Desulfobacteraceae bacterium]
MELKPIADTLQMKIEEDGTITCITGKISAEVHLAADIFLDEVTRLTGGERHDERLAQQQEHNHDHLHHHTHEQHKIRS